MKQLVITERENIVAIADAVRNKIGSNEQMTIGGIVDNINGIAMDSGVNITLSNNWSVADDGDGNITINNEGV